jgi:Mlc titration factor MtfA (ptsG expression regulator)
MQSLIYTITAAIILIIIYNVMKKKNPLPQPTADKEKEILQQHVLFYQQLNNDGKINLEKRIRAFLQKVRVTGVETDVEDIDRVFVAAAAIIPIFAFKDWEYRNIHEVLIYPNSFNENYETKGHSRDVLGMVGDGVMQNVMILSKTDLRNGFLNSHSKSNAAIHEFVHLIDKEDGHADGCPENLLPHKYALPWLKRIHQEIQLIQTGKSDINPYGATSEAEFLAVASEYFFSQPHLMQEKHPALFSLLKAIFTPIHK